MRTKNKQTSPNYDYFIKANTAAYKGEWIAISGEKIVSHGKDAGEVYRKAQKKCKTSDISLAKIPNEEVLILKSSKLLYSDVEFHPYIDSGADVTLIPLSLGKFLGFKIDEKKIEQIGGIKGSVPVIYQPSKMKIGGIKLNVQIAWALIEEVPPLLGRTDIFDFFHITFKQDQGIITFERP